MNSVNIPFYNNRVNDFTNAHCVSKIKYNRVAILRLFIFLAAIVSWLYITTITLGIGLFLGFLFTVLFFILIKIHLTLDIQKKKLEALIKINSKEEKCCTGNFSEFPDGIEYTDHQHPYSFDIDLFGSGSIFQYINRTSTLGGKNKLAFWLRNAPLSENGIIENQTAINDLKEKTDFRQNLSILGEIYPISSDEETKISSWLELPDYFKNKFTSKILLNIVPLVNLSTLVLTILGIVPFSIFLSLFICNLFVLSFKLKDINKYYSQVSKSNQVLKKLSETFHLIQKEHFEAEHLKQKQILLTNAIENSAFGIQKLTRLIDWFDNRNNIILGVILNGLLQWDLQCVWRIEKWKQHNRPEYKQWTETVAEFDALISLANMAFNRPDFNFPTLSKDINIMSTESLGHPLLPLKNRVDNDFKLDKNNRFSIITGANMAGKSTFLRSIACNWVLAGIGAPVCANEFIFKPMPLFSSMRTEDSLMKNESYFFAELKRLQFIIKQLENGTDSLVILDEILRGTNSEDKRKGSTGFLRKISQYNAFGLIATHDLELAKLADQNSDLFNAQCFEVEIADNKLLFNYKLSKGVTKNMNASFLMKQMGII